MMVEDRLLTFSIQDLRLDFEPETGAWMGLQFADEPILRGLGNDFSVSLEGWTLHKRRLLTTEQVHLPDGWRLVLEYELCGEDHLRLLATQTFDIHPGRLERRLTLQWAASGLPRRLLSVKLTAEGLAAGDAERSRVSLPMTRRRPSLPLSAAAQLPTDFVRDADGFPNEAAGLDTGMGALLLTRAEPPLHVAVVPLPNRCPVKTRLHGIENQLVLTQEFACESWAEEGVSIDAAAQAFLFTPKPWQEGLRAVANQWRTGGYESPADRPAWARDAVILETDLAFFGGLPKLTARLDEVHDLGFNTLYLMPWHHGHWNGYGTYRYDEINPAYGTFADLRRLCDEAHRRGMRVLFDLLVNVAGEDSPYPAEHPDWFYRAANGDILRHPTWDSWCLDPASPGFRRFLTAYAVRCCTEWGADGFRVDAAAYRGGNWNNFPDRQPHEHSHAVFTLIGEIRAAIRAEKADAICMAECFGPVQTPVSDLVAYQWVAWLDWANDGLLSGRIDGAMLCRLLGEHFLAMPRDTWLVGYTHTHDTVAFEHRDLDAPAVAAFFATLSLLCAATMVFGGGWEMRARPTGAEEAGEYRQLFAAKAALGGVASHELTFLETGNPALLAARRPSRLGPVRVVTNFGAARQALPGGGKSIYSRLGSSPGVIEAFDTVVTQI